MSKVRVDRLEDLNGDNGILVSDLNKVTESALRVLKPALTFPTVRDNGSPLEIGDIITNLADEKIYSWKGAGWVSLDESTQQLEAELSLPDGSKKVGGVSVQLQDITELSSFIGRRPGDSASVVSLGSGWAMNASYPFPSGGGEFVWDATSTEPPITGMLVQVIGSETGRWKRKYSGAVHVTWTGAIPDGLTKSSAAVQLALDNYRAVYMPPGKFLLESYASHALLYTANPMTCGVKITKDQKCREFYGAGAATQVVSELGVTYVSVISRYNVDDCNIHSFNIDGLYDRSGASFISALTGIRDQSIRRCSTYNMSITNFKYHCVAMYGGSDAVLEPACLWNKMHNMYLDGGGQTSLIIYSSEWTGLTLPNEHNEFSNIFAVNSHVYFGIEVRKSNYNVFSNIVTNGNQKGGVNLEEGASHNRFTNLVSRYNGYGLHMVSNGAGDITGNHFVSFDFSDNRVHNVMAYQEARANHFTDGHFDRAGTGNGWRSEDSTSYGNYFNRVTCKDNFGEGLLFQGYENLTEVETTGNGLRGITVFGASKLRRVTSRGNGTNITTLAGVFHDIEDCDFGPRHGILTKDGIKIGQFVEVGQSGSYTTSSAIPTEVVEPGSQSALVWKNTLNKGKFISIPTGFFAGSGFTSLKVMLRVKTDGPSRLLRDINAATNITIPVNSEWIWVPYIIAISSLTATSMLNIRYESASDVGFVLLDGYQLALI